MLLATFLKQSSLSYTSWNQLQFYWKKQGNSDVTGASAKLLTLSKQKQSKHISATLLYIALLTPHQRSYSSYSTTCLNPRIYLIKCHQIDH